MDKRVPTYVNSPYIGTFQYPTAGPDRIHENPNTFLLPANMPFVGTFRHNMPIFLPSFLRTARRDASTQTEDASDERATQTSPVNLDAFVIVTYPPDQDE